VKRGIFNPGMMMENSNGNLILSNHRSDDEKCTEIEDNDGKRIAKFCFENEKRGFIEKYISEGSPSTFFIQIFDNSFDRKTLLSFFICLYAKILEDVKSSSAC